MITMSRIDTAELVRNAAELLLQACGGAPCRPSPAGGKAIDALDAGVIGIARIYGAAAGPRRPPRRG